MGKIRKQKERIILEAAEEVFSTYGFDNARMEVVAKKAGVSKGTVYFYYESKENLFMAITHRAFSYLIDLYYKTVALNINKPGGVCFLALLRVYLEFCEKNPYYFVLFSNYLNLLQISPNKELSHLSEAMRSSPFLKKVNAISYLPISIPSKEIKRGQEDGSVKNNRKAQLIHLTVWGAISGYTQLRTTRTLSSDEYFAGVKLVDWKEYTLKLCEKILDDE